MYKKNIINVEGKGIIHVLNFDDDISVLQRSDILKEYREKSLAAGADDSNTVFICASDKCPATITFTGSKVQYKLVSSDDKPLPDEVFEAMVKHFYNNNHTLSEWFELIR